MAQTVLLVEDEDSIAIALQFVIGKAGYGARRLRSGRAVLEAMRADPPDLILLDLMLPDRPGDVICREIRADPALCATPVVVMSASEGAPARSRRCGADAFIAKPFANHAVLSTIDRLLARRRASS